MIKALNKLGIEGTYLNLLKTIQNKCITNIVLNVTNEHTNETKYFITKGKNFL
jgi:hypothetical protein